MKKTRVFTMLIVIMLSVGMIMTGCKTPAPASTAPSGSEAPAAGEIKIGAIMPITGPIALYGTGTVNAIQIAVNEINAAGGINGMQVKLIAEDDEGKSDKSVLAYKKLTSQDKVDVIIGCLTSDCSLAVAPLAQDDKIPMISTSSTNLKVTQAGDYIFRTCYLDPFQGKGCAKLAYEQLGKKTAAIMFDNANDYSIGLADAFEESFKAMGGTITNREAYTKGDTDFSAILTKIKASNPDVLFIPDYYPTVALIAPQARTLGMTDVVMMGGDGWDEIVSNAGDEVVGSYYLNHFTADTTDPKGAEFVAKYKAAYNGERPNALAVLGYDAMEVVAQAIKAAGSTDHQMVRDALTKVEGDFLTGHIKFDENRNPVKSAVVIQVVKGEDGKLHEKYIGTVAP
jgi:branched-chain amino acid transport system substrate-binding protein